MSTAPFFRTQDSETRPTRLAETPVHETPVGFLGYRPVYSVGDLGAYRAVPLRGFEEQLGQFLEVVVVCIRHH